ncbi:MAG TPA: hypothetical protein VKA53_06885 [Thermoanaerobaculia bacterium]|nr:hypothetical protein [Thermoanaerobaculia bacterium]
MMPLGITLKAVLNPHTAAFADFWLPIVVPIVLAFVGSLIYHALKEVSTPRSWTRLLTFSFIFTDLWVAVAAALVIFVGGFFPGDVLPMKLAVLGAVLVAALVHLLFFRASKDLINGASARAVLVLIGLLLVLGVRWFSFAEVDAWWLVAVPPHQITRMVEPGRARGLSN